EEVLEEALERVEREDPGRERVGEPVELVPDVEVERLARRGRDEVARGAERRSPDPPPLLGVEAEEVVALEREHVVGRVEERAVEPERTEPAGEGRRDRGPRGAADDDVEVGGLEALEGLLERCEAADLVHRARDAASTEAQAHASRGLGHQALGSSSLATPT